MLDTQDVDLSLEVVVAAVAASKPWLLQEQWGSTTWWLKCTGAPTRTRGVGHHATSQLTPSASCLYRHHRVWIHCNGDCDDNFYGQNRLQYGARGAPCSRVPYDDMQHRSMMLDDDDRCIHSIWTKQVKTKESSKSKDGSSFSSSCSPCRDVDK